MQVLESLRQTGVAHPKHLVRDYADGLYRWAWARTGGDADMAQEIVQRTFLSAIERPSAYDPSRGEPWGWLVGMAMNHLKSLRRERGRGEPLPEALAGTPEGDRRAVHEALTALPPAQQSLLEAHYLEGKPVEELARELGVAPSTAWARLAEARESFRKVWGGNA